MQELAHKATLKLRRQIAEEMWKDVIDKLYID